MAIFDLSEHDAEPPSPEPVAEGPCSPFKMGLAILVLVAALAGWRLGMDGSKGLSPAILADTFTLRWPQPPAPVVAKRPATQSKGNGKLPQISAVFVDDSNSLDPFFAALWKLEQGKGTGAVTVLHYGDSPTTADLITGDVRAQLQRRFGDAGRGYTLIAKPWAWYGHRGVEISDHGWKMRTGVGLMREGIYGLGGAAFEGQPGAWSKFRLTESQQTVVNVEYLAKSGGGTFAVEADDRRLVEQTTSSETQEAESVKVELPPDTKTVSIRPTSGTVTLFGADFRRGPNGLLYDSLGLNGATTSVLARVLQPVLWKQELERAAPALVVVNYGSNESSFGAFVHKQYAAELRLAIQRIRLAAPGVPILVMSPMDRGERAGMNDIETMSTIPEIVAIQRQAAAETHCAFFDTYDAMGGDGTMARWYVASPRLVTADFLHPTPQGATIVAELFVEQLGLGYNRWKMQHGIGLPAANPADSLKAEAAKSLPESRHATKHAGKKARM
ncbi:MAG: GDSL-type esterase/lipase family protein [Terracidiphilus sp.]|jgi:lysophospholipase L1-like esterase